MGLRWQEACSLLLEVVGQSLRKAAGGIREAHSPEGESHHAASGGSLLVSAHFPQFLNLCLQRVYAQP